MSVNARAARQAGENAADALVAGIQDGGSDIRKFVEQVQKNPQALVTSNTTPGATWRDFYVTVIIVTLGWWGFVIDGDDTTWSPLDALGIIYVSAVVFKVLR